MDEDEPHANEDGALIAKEKDPEAHQSAARKQQRWGLLTSICKVNITESPLQRVTTQHSNLLALLQLQNCILSLLPMDQKRSGQLGHLCSADASILTFMELPGVRHIVLWGARWSPAS